MNIRVAETLKICFYNPTIIICYLKTIDYIYSVVILFSLTIFMKKNKIIVWWMLQKSRVTLRNHFRTICKLLIIATSPLFLAMGLVILLMNFWWDGMIATSARNDIYFLEPRNSILTWVELIAMLGTFYFVLGLLKAQIRLMRWEKPTEKSLFATSRKQFMQYLLWVVFSVLFVFAIFFLIFWSIRLILSGHYDSETIKRIKYIFVIVRMFFIIVCGIYLGIRFQFFKFFITKGETAIDAFKKSREITDGHEWKLFCLMLSYTGITLAASLVWGLLFVALVWMLKTIERVGPWGWIASLITIILLVLWYFALIIFAYATKELSLTQAFLELDEEREN